MPNEVKLAILALVVYGAYKLANHNPAANPAMATTGYGVGGNTYGPPSQFERGTNTAGFAMMGRAQPGSRGNSNGF